MKDDIKQEIRKIVKFLDMSVTEEHLERVIEDVGLSKMKADPAMMKRDGRYREGATGHIRSGEKGGWKKYFTSEQNQWFDEKYKESYQSLGVDVVYE